jgi:hypothetical protein
MPGNVAGGVAGEGIATAGGAAEPDGLADRNSGDNSPYDGFAGGLEAGCSVVVTALGGLGGEGTADVATGDSVFLAGLLVHITNPPMMTSAATPPTPAIRPIGNELVSSVGRLKLARAAAAEGAMVGSAEPAPPDDFGFSGDWFAGVT